MARQNVQNATSMTSATKENNKQIGLNVVLSKVLHDLQLGKIQSKPSPLDNQGDKTDQGVHYC
jgi:hypothetical protein